MAGDLYYVFTGEAVWGAIEGDDYFVKDFFLNACGFLILLWTDYLAKGEGVGLAIFEFVTLFERTEDAAACSNGIRPTDANDGNAADATGGGDGADGVQGNVKLKNVN